MSYHRESSRRRRRLSRSRDLLDRRFRRLSRSLSRERPLLRLSLFNRKVSRRHIAKSLLTFYAAYFLIVLGHHQTSFRRRHLQLSGQFLRHASSLFSSGPRWHLTFSLQAKLPFSFVYNMDGMYVRTFFCRVFAFFMIGLRALPTLMGLPANTVPPSPIAVSAACCVLNSTNEYLTFCSPSANI